MAVSNRARRIRLAILAVIVAAIIWSFMPKHPATGPVKDVANRKALPEFSLPAVGGGEWKMADHRGKVLLVNFWATWCPPCRRETPELVDLHEKYEDRGFSVVGISLDDDPASVVPSFVKQYRMPYPVLIPTEQFGFANEIESLPTSVLIDREGRIARTYLGAVTAGMLSGDVESLLSERVPVQAGF